MQPFKRKLSPRVATVPSCSTSGRPIRAPVIRAMEEQQRATQKALDAIHEVTELVEEVNEVLANGAPLRTER